VAVQALQNSTAAWASVLPLYSSVGAKLDATEPGSAFAARYIALFHDPAFRGPKLS
jgi:hypothetical protein